MSTLDRVGHGDSSTRGGLMNDKAGWFYVGNGLLRYRDEAGWTEHFLEAESVRGFDGPPPPPVGSDETRIDEIPEPAGLESGRGVGLRTRARRLGRGGRQRR